MKLLFFGRLRDVVGSHELDCSPPASVVDSESLRLWIGAEHTALLDAKVRMSIDNVLVASPAPIADVRVVAFLPPVSGG